MSKSKKKAKKNRGRQSDQVLMKKVAAKAASTKINPFEVKVNRTKHNILGRSQKHDRGLPGISRQKTFTKRKNTLLKEYRLQGKASVFADKRIGEKEFLSNEEKVTARLIAQRSKHHKNSVYNLNEDDEVTHLGVPVSEIEKHHDIASDSDSDDNLGADFVSKAHFGGFLTKKDESKASHKDIINDLIAQSKQRKHEKQVLKDATLEMTETLDEKWKELRKLLPNKKSGAKVSPLSMSSTPTNEDYDMMMKKLKFQTVKPIERNAKEHVPDEQQHVPTSYDEFQQLISGLSGKEALAVIEKIISSSSQPENKRKLENMFGILLQYLKDLCHSEHIPFEILNTLGEYLHIVAAMFPVSSSELFLDIIQSKRQELWERLDEKRSRKFACPKFDYLVLLKLSGNLFSTPQTYHSVLTPCILFMTEILTECKTTDAQSIVSGLFICSILLQCASANKQIHPEALTFLLDVINASTNSDICPLMHATMPNLCFNNTLKLEISDWSLPLSYVIKNEADLNDLTKAKIVKLALDISGQFGALYKDSEAFKELFEPFEKALAMFSTMNYPAEIISSADKLLKQIQQKTLKVPLTAQKCKPKMLKLYEPKIETYSEKRQAKQDSKKKLLPKYKRELKGAVREIRRDTSFLARHVLQEQIERDQERKRKVNKLYQELAQQEGSFRALTKRKKK